MKDDMANRQSEETSAGVMSEGRGRHGSHASTLGDDKHEVPETLSDTDTADGGSQASTRQAAAAAAAGTTPTSRVGSNMSRTVSEFRDGIANQRELEMGPDPEKADDPPEEAVDPNLVKWDGPDDPMNPKNWKISKKWAAVVTISFFTLISPTASSMTAPALVDIGHDLHITSTFQLALSLSIFVLAYALGPLGWGPLSELYGRVIIIQVSNLWFLLFNLGCGFARTESELIAFRFLAGIGGSAPLAIGGGVLSDLFTPDQRGKAISMYSMAPVLGPAIGPIAGGWVAERTTWRWVFWATTIACAVIQTAGLFLLQETYAPILLHRKKMRLIRETGNTALRTELDDPSRTVAQTIGRALTRPFRLLFTQLILQALAVYMCFIYGMLYLLLTTFPTLFSEEYHESTGIQSLNYISLAVGFVLGSQVCAPLQDRIYASLKRRYGLAQGLPEFRVPLMLPGMFLLPTGMLIYSWTAEAKTHWIGPNIGAAIIGVAIIISFQCIQGYLVDTYARHAASAVAAATVLRSLAGFGFPLFAPAMYARLGYGWGGTVLAAFSIVLGWPSPFLLWKYGAKLRAKSKYSA